MASSGVADPPVFTSRTKVRGLAVLLSGWLVCAACERSPASAPAGSAGVASPSPLAAVDRFAGAIEDSTENSQDDSEDDAFLDSWHIEGPRFHNPEHMPPPWQWHFLFELARLTPVGDHIWLEEATNSVVLLTFVATPRGRLEFLVTSPRGRAHESVLIFHGSARDLRDACARVGFAGPEHPAGSLRYFRDPRRPVGETADLEVEFLWQGRRFRHLATDLLFDTFQNTTMEDVGFTYTGALSGELSGGKERLSLANPASPRSPAMKDWAKAPRDAVERASTPVFLEHRPRTRTPPANTRRPISAENAAKIASPFATGAGAPLTARRAGMAQTVNGISTASLGKPALCSDDAAFYLNRLPGARFLPDRYADWRYAQGRPEENAKHPPLRAPRNAISPRSPAAFSPPGKVAGPRQDSDALVRDFDTAHRTRRVFMEAPAPARDRVERVTLRDDRARGQAAPLPRQARYHRAVAVFYRGLLADATGDLIATEHVPWCLFNTPQFAPQSYLRYMTNSSLTPPKRGWPVLLRIRKAPMPRPLFTGKQIDVGAMVTNMESARPLDPRALEPDPDFVEQQRPTGGGVPDWAGDGADPYVEEW